MQQPQQVQTHHQIVEEILPEQMSDEVTKEVINQFLPQRKRKPRVAKTPNKQNPSKIIKLEPQASGSEIITEISSIADQDGEEMIIEKQEQVSEMIESIEEHEQAEQSSSEVKVKGEGKTSKDKSSELTLLKSRFRFFNSIQLQSQNRSHNQNSPLHAPSAQQPSDNPET